MSDLVIQERPSAPEMYSSSVRSFIPLLYVAWADGMLSPSEVRIIHRKLDGLTDLVPADRQLLKRWSDPSEWPSEEVFKSWIRLMKDATGNINSSEMKSLAEVGMRMAAGNSIAGLESTSATQTREALEHLQQDLGLAGLSTIRSLSRGTEQVEVQSDALGLQQILDGRNSEIKNRVRALLADPVFAIEKMPTKEEHRLQVNTWMGHLAQQGFGLLSYPKEIGGQDDMDAYASVFEILAYHDLSLTVKFGVQFGLFGGSILNLGTDQHHQKYLHRTGACELAGCFAMTETGHGSNVRDLETTAIYDADTGLIDVHSPHYRAGKEYIGNALDARMAVVFAQLIVQGENHGVHAVLVRIRDERGTLLAGVRVEDNGYKMGLNGVDNGRIWFDHVKVPRENLLDRFGRITLMGRYESPIPNASKRFFTMLGTLVGGRICVGKAALSASKVALAVAVKYGNSRRQFGPDHEAEETLILDYPTHQRRLMPRLAKVFAAHFALEKVMKDYTQRDEKSMRRLETTAAGLKAYATWLATDTIQECREACGGKGYLWENQFADLKADSDIFTTFEGDNVVLLQLVAKGLLSDFRAEFNDAGFMGVYRFLLSQAEDGFATINPISKRKTDADHLLDPKFFEHALDFRQRKLLHTMVTRMRSMLRKRFTPYDIFLRTQTHMVALAQAHVEYSVLQSFSAVCSTLSPGPDQDVLQQVLALYALSTIEDKKGWYLEQDYMEGVKSKAIRRQVDRLCRELRHEADRLVNSFGIPRALLRAPIANAS